MRVFEDGDPETKPQARVLVQNFIGIFLGYGTLSVLQLQEGGELKGIFLDEGDDLYISDEDCLWIEVLPQDTTKH